ncbi:MAG: hypothetical protein JXA83_11545 [Acidimicrobiales bacterium]|nr:hypothetical protein [Acidimicrobiales bacterium]
MPSDDRDDPGADTAMFRAYVDEPTEPAVEPAVNRTMVIAAVVAVVVLVLLALVLLA